LSAASIRSVCTARERSAACSLAVAHGSAGIAALREMPADHRPKKVYGCEVWRDLDWMVDSDKVVFAVDGHENIQNSLVGVFDSQIAGGKRYDLATQARRRNLRPETASLDSRAGKIRGCGASNAAT